MKASDIAWALLSASGGNYQGQGLNHEGQEFRGQLTLEVLIPEKLMLLKSTAVGLAAEAEVFHDEVSTIGRDHTGTLTLFVSSNNHPAITPHAFERLEETTTGDKKIVFRFGLPQEVDTFREEISLIVHADRSLTHSYAWGMPGGEFRDRSGSRMQRKTSSQNFAWDPASERVFEA